MEPFIGAIFSFGFNFAPLNWALCDGSLIAISQNETLYSLIGTTYGGDGQTTFGLPNLQGRVPIGTGTGPGLPGYVIGQAGGNETVTLTAANLPSHTHPVLNAQIPVSGTNGEIATPGGNYFGLGSGAAGSVYNSQSTVAMAPNNGNTGATGNGLPMDILTPYLVVNYCIALYGIFPSRN